MNKENVFKIVLGAAAAYILWRWWQGQQAPVVQQPVAGTSPNTSANAAVNAAAAAAAAAPTTARTITPVEAARDPQNAALSPLRFTVDGWNYYRSQAGLPIRDALEYPGITPENRESVTVSGAEYHSWLGSSGQSTSGVSGLGGAFIPAFGNFWGGGIQ